MPLTPGTRLGVYEVTAQIGVGGMGEVYRATDSNLKRSVAIKVLPASVAGDADRLARFQREAEVLAALNHPNIGAIYGLEKTPDFTALVMELVEGDDLSQRIARGAMPIDEALPMARQIAEALEAAHEQGIIHRDLKPANIKVRADGTVKVLDFGLAKAVEPTAGSSPSMAMSPTLSVHATQAGMILGTAAYMAPEQARGKTVDRRADIWAFGVVLFEMLTGTRAFPGEDITDTLAAVVRSEPQWDTLPPTVPARVSQALRVCLRKDPKQRASDIRDVRLALEGAFETVAMATPAVVSAVSRTRERVAWIGLGVVSLAALALGAFAYLGRVPADARQTRFFIAPPDTWRLVELPNQAGQSPLPLAVSPDGRRIAFLAEGTDGTPLLWVRALDTLAAQPLAGTEGAASPFWSPDSRSLGFFADGKLKKIDASGGPAVTLCDAPNSRGGTWSRDGIIVFNPNNLVALQKVSAAGGVPAPATVLGAGENAHRRPYFLPDGRHFLYTATTASADPVTYVASLDSPERTLLVHADANNVGYSQGHLLFVREATLMAQPFDLGRLTLTGEPVPIAEQLQGSNTTPPNRFFSASDAGVLVYQTGVSGGGGQQLTWFDRTGKLLGLVEKSGQYNTVALSPDGTRVAVSRADLEAAGRQTGNTDLWVHEFARATSTRLTFDPARDWMAVWSPDGSRLAWGSPRDSASDNLYQKGANGAGADEALLKSSDLKLPYDWSPDGRFLVYGVRTGTPLRTELWVLPLTGDARTPTTYLQQPGFNVHQARFSPDGRFVAYTSNASGQNEVYVQPFPVATGGKWQVSHGGGGQPRWRRDGKELFYISADSTVMAVPVGTTATATTPLFTPGVPKALFAAPIQGGGTTNNVTRYDVTADGQKFLINAVPSDTTTAASPTPITVVLNWTVGLTP